MPHNFVPDSFHTGVTAEALQTKIYRKSAISLQRGSLIQNFRYKGSLPTNHFCTASKANECLTTLPLTVFTQRNFVADFLQAKCDFTWKSAVLRFWDPLTDRQTDRQTDLGATYDDHLRLIGKRVVDFLLVLIELFWIGVTYYW